MQNINWSNQPDQFSSFPTIDHLCFADRKELWFGHDPAELQSLHNYLSDNKHKYLQFLRQKGRHPSFDIYACFQPFNEAFKALYPFVHYIKERLRDGDVIVNLWDRSGWTASMLAGWFPRQQILTVWEGDKDILGYRGFHYWMSSERRSNHTVLFADLNRSLPLGSSTIAAIVGLDVLHRFHQPELLKELHRIAKPDAPILFPHVHLTNSAPEPFFERGCIQLHGRQYQQFFNNVALATKRTGYVLSEPATFLWNDLSNDVQKTLVSEPENSDYNACIAWLPTEAEPPLLKPWRGHEQANWEEMFLLQNPLLKIEPTSGTIALKEEGWGFDIMEFLSQHPVYAKRIAGGWGKRVKKDLGCVLYWARQGLSLKEILEKTLIGKDHLQELLKFAWETDLAQAVPVDRAGFRLQTLLGHQQYILEKNENQLAAFWKQRAALHGDNVWCKTGGDVLTYKEADELIVVVQKALLADGLQKGDTIVLCGETHSELLLTFWAAVGLGIVVMPLLPNQSTHKLQEYIRLVKPRLAVVAPSLFPFFNKVSECKTIILDEPNESDYLSDASFENWLAATFENDLQIAEEPKPNDVAVILWTTGSTGNPKGIPVTHAQLIRSGRSMTECYHWKSSDRYYALGGLETMSGLRHATVSIAEAGACCVLPVKATNTQAHLQFIAEEKITILTANPAFYKHILFLLRGPATQLSVRLALCTGNALSDELRQAWQQKTGIRLYNYYGLTETTGICIAEPLDHCGKNNSIGFPVDCLYKIVNEDGQRVPQGETGELCIYGAGVFNGYYGNSKATEKVLKDGWLHTGDLAMVSEGGGLTLCGRIADIVKLPSGERVELTAIEEIVAGVPNLEDWAVLSVNKAEKESIAVFFVTNSSIQIEEIVATIKQAVGKKLGAYAVPTIIDSVPSIPRGNHNKVFRTELVNSYYQTINQL